MIDLGFVMVKDCEMKVLRPLKLNPEVNLQEREKEKNPKLRQER